MLFVYLDEFGHIGPYVARAETSYNESPVFGVGGIILPEAEVRNFATFFLQQKQFVFRDEIERSRQIPAKWEKKGTSFIRPSPLEKYPVLRQLLNRILNRLERRGGGVFYYGREKFRNRTDLNSNGLYKTVVSHAIRKLNGYCEDNGETFILIFDQHSARKELLEASIKTMYGEKPCRAMASPPFEVESYANQNIQCADWIATIVGRIFAYSLSPVEFADYQIVDRYLGDRLQNLAVRSECMRRPAYRR
ncbi:DUF3800 domain-containing protein [Stappia sp.]|uniref:DUF3800 domain-containing protein n=1 Tax=Stappia sp. TaxID=1870903 RepID=UPI0032D972A7